MFDGNTTEKIRSIVCYDGMGETLGNIFDEKPEILIGGLRNSDEYKLLAMLAEMYPDKLIDGMNSAARVSGAERMILIVPHEKYLDALRQSAEAADVELVVQDFIKVREYKNAAYINFVTLLNISRVLADTAITQFVSTDGESIVELPVGGRLDSVLSPDGLKAVLIDHRYYEPGILEREISADFPLGSGYIRGIKNTECIVQATLSEITKLRELSCGICTFCREGLFQIETTLKGLARPGTKKDQFALMKEIGEAMLCSYKCSVGAKAAYPMLSALELFEPEINSHCGNGNCPAGGCREFLKIFIDPQKCQGCGNCTDVCPEDCIEGKNGYISMIDEFDCIKCGKCIEVCEYEAVQFAKGRVPKLPDRLTRVGRFKR